MWTLVVAISVFVVSSVAITLRSVIHRGHKSVALTVDVLIRTAELFVVAETAGLALCVYCFEESTDVLAS